MVVVGVASGCGGGGAAAGATGHPPGSRGQTCVATWGHTDGDTFRCATEGTVKVVRLAAVDAPERGQPGWAEARRRLESLTPSGARIDCHGRDRHDRHLCRVSDPGGRPVAPILLAEGLAWFASRYAGELPAPERDAWPQAMAAARAARRGLWVQPTPMAPWVCRERMAQGLECR